MSVAALRLRGRVSVRLTTLDRVTESQDQMAFTEQSLLDAIHRSGYPLQARVVDVIRETFGDWQWLDAISEEWSFVDPETQQSRNLDLLIQRGLRGVNDELPHDPGVPTDSRALLRHQLSLLIECKQSSLPYVFFTRPHVYPEELPIVLGAPADDIELGYAGEEPFAVTPLTDIIGYAESAQRPGHVASVAAKASFRKGGELELSGADVFRGLTLPVRKALQHYRSLCSTPRFYCTVRYTYPVVVLDAPMYAYSSDGELSPVDVVRVALTEPSEEAWDTTFNTSHSLDFVKLDHLAVYLAACEKRSTEIAKRLDSMATVALMGRGILPPFNSKSPDEGSNDPLSGLQSPVAKDEEVAWLRTRFIQVHEQSD